MTILTQSFFLFFFKSHPKVIAACRLSARLLERVVLGHTVAETLQWAIALSLASKTTTSSIPCPREGRRGSKVGQITIRGTDSKSVDSAYGFNEDEREFLTSILPAVVGAVPDMDDMSWAIAPFVRIFLDILRFLYS